MIRRPHRWPQNSNPQADGERTVEVTVGMNYQIQEEIHRKAKVTAEGKGMSLKQYVEDALTEKNERHKAEIAAMPASRFRRGRPG